LAGVLAPLFALRGANDSGIGTTRTLIELIDWAAEHGLGFIQMLPINETGSDHSPYNLLSSMAIEPTTLSTRPGDLPGLSQADFAEIEAMWPVGATAKVDYPLVQQRNSALFQKAAENFFSKKKIRGLHEEFGLFCQEAEEWLEDYTLHAALKAAAGGAEVISQWPAAWQTPGGARQWLEAQPTDVQKAIAASRRLAAFIQWVGDRQWRQAHEHAKKRGVLLIGDVPVGVSVYSVDVWSQPGLFDLNRSCGAPPEKVFQADPFTTQWGQNWGFPLYQWEEMSRDNFWWWRRRLRALRQYFDILRVDHALGFYRIYSFPWRPERNAEFIGLTPEEAKAKTGGLLPGFIPNEDDTEEHRASNCQHGEVLLGILIEETGPEGLIAEDLGEVPDYVRPSLARLGVSGFKIPQWERTEDGSFVCGLDYPRLAITTYATHDHPPLCEIWNELWARCSSEELPAATQAKKELLAFLGFGGCWGAAAEALLGPYSAKIQAVLLRGLLTTNAWLAANSINDLLGTADRFNVPGTADGQNWSARLAHPIAQWAESHAEAMATWAGLVPLKN
jgi:4-alpha-glucanotransferase